MLSLKFFSCDMMQYLFFFFLSFFVGGKVPEVGERKKRFHRSSKTEIGVGEVRVGAELEEVVKTIPLEVIDTWKMLGEMSPCDARKRYLEEFTELFKK